MRIPNRRLPILTALILLGTALTALVAKIFGRFSEADLDEIEKLVLDPTPEWQDPPD